MPEAVFIPVYPRCEKPQEAWLVAKKKLNAPLVIPLSLPASGRDLDEGCCSFLDPDCCCGWVCILHRIANCLPGAGTARNHCDSAVRHTVAGMYWQKPLFLGTYLVDGHLSPGGKSGREDGGTHAANLLLMIMLRRDARPMRSFSGVASSLHSCQLIVRFWINLLLSPRVLCFTSPCLPCIPKPLASAIAYCLIEGSEPEEQAVRLQPICELTRLEASTPTQGYDEALEETRWPMLLSTYPSTHRYSERTTRIPGLGNINTIRTTWEVKGGWEAGVARNTNRHENRSFKIFGVPESPSHLMWWGSSTLPR